MQRLKHDSFLPPSHAASLTARDRRQQELEKNKYCTFCMPAIFLQKNYQLKLILFYCHNYLHPRLQLESTQTLFNVINMCFRRILSTICNSHDYSMKYDLGIDVWNCTGNVCTYFALAWNMKLCFPRRTTPCADCFCTTHRADCQHCWAAKSNTDRDPYFTTT